MGKNRTVREKLSPRSLATLVIVACVLIGAGTIYARYPKTASAAMDRGYYGIARSYLLSAAKNGDARSQNALGNLYYIGLGGSRDYKIAADWYLRSAAQSHAPAQVNLANLYSQGLGVRRDDIRAYGWLRQARINRSVVAENKMRWIAGSLSLSPGQIQRAGQLYDKLDDLLPANKASGS